jgi:hypothetical protein
MLRSTPWRIPVAPYSVREAVSKAAIAFVACTLFLLGARAGLAETAKTGTLTIPTVASPPPLDPKADVAAWGDAASATLTWDVQHQRGASEQTLARVVTDGKDIYVRFDVKQREPLLAQQHTTDVGDGTDDEVWIDLWPSGSGGYYYQFAATSNGTHYQYSTENTGYAPIWQTSGATRDGGFTITMKIPLNVMRGSGGSSSWKVQLVRVVRSTGERQIWSYDPAQTNGDDVRYAGDMGGVAKVTATRPLPRVAVYGLGGLGSPGTGYSTSRMGADLSVPLTATSSFYATLHPDFSNVEVDQQTISPTAYQRSFTEYRPFFTQGNSFYDNFDCDVCANIQELYTPAIPTPRDGYAVEGKAGHVSAAAFDTIGDARNDGAAAFSLQTSNSRWRLTGQTVFANIPGVTDHVDTTNLTYNDGKHIDAFFTYGSDSGTNVLVPNRAQRYDGGGYWYTSTFGIGASMREIGQYYNPVDGFVQHTDIAGYAAFENKVWLFSKNDVLNSIQFGSFLDRYHDHTGALDQTDNAIWLDFLTRNLIDINGVIGSGYLLVSNGIFTPVSQNGIGVTWHSGSYNNPGSNLFHGSSATPTSVTWNQGRFGPGVLQSWTRVTNMRAGPRAILTVEFDDTRQWLDAGGVNWQWLERFGVNYLAGSNSSVGIGVRRIIGTPPLVDVASPVSSVNAWNLSFNYHRRVPHNELYFAYGDPSPVSTVPQWILKVIHYFGADKGT